MPSVEEQEAIRIAYNKLISSFYTAKRADDARAVIDLAIAQGLWREPLQRPIHFATSVPGQAVHDPARFSFIEVLEANHPVIRAEVDAAENSRRFKLVKEDDLIDYGHWGQVVLCEGGQVFEDNCRAFPETWKIVSSVPEIMAGAGAVYLSWLEPDTHIVPHFGPTNTRLRVHLGVKVPTGPKLRVKDQYLTWQEGKCLVFDDSFEHEVWNPSSEHRVVLLIDIFHPDLSAEDRAAIPQGQQSFEQRIDLFLRSMQLTRIQKNGAEIQFLPTAEATGPLHGFLDDLDQDAVYLYSGQLRSGKGQLL